MTDAKTPAPPQKTEATRSTTCETLTPSIRDRFPTGAAPGETLAQRDERVRKAR